MAIPRDLSLEDALRIDTVCARFEGEQRSGVADIQELLREVEPPLRKPLLEELLALDLELRTRRGESPALSEYLAGFPEESAVVRAVEASRTHVSPPRTPGVDASGRAFGGYTLLRELGHGGQGQVFLARDNRLHREVALKILRRAHSLSTMARLRFEREAEVASRLEHPGICTVYEVGEFEDTPFIAMQLVQGLPLDRVIKSGRASEGRLDVLTSVFAKKDAEQDRLVSKAHHKTSSGALRKQEVIAVCAFFEDAARALHTAHEAGLVHRDVKPANIMIGGDGKPVILDFGLAHDDASQGASLTHTGDLMGTPAYMSPEQIVTGRIDIRTDVYSLGVTLYECLTLRLPHQAETRAALFEAIGSGPVPDPRLFNPAIPRDLRVVLDTALDKDPDRRYQAMSDLAEELRRVRCFEPIHARPAGPLLKTWRLAQRNPIVATLSASLIVFLSLSTVVLYWKQEEVLAESRKKDAALLNERSANEARDAALQRYEQMSDVALLDDLVSRADRLWPCEPDRSRPMAIWLAEADALLRARSEHEDAVAALRKRALPYSEAEREEDGDTRRRVAPELQQELERLLADRAATRQRLAVARHEQRSRLSEKVEDLKDSLEALEASPDYRLTWRFDDLKDQWRHQVLTRLMRGLDELETLRGDIARRHGIASTVEQVSRREAAPVWDACRRSLAADPRFRGLVLEPQLGLVPLGRGRRSRLWHFWHVGSGAQPRWSGELESGDVKPEEGDGLVFVLLPRGTFTMGAQAAATGDANHDPDAETGEGPPHEVKVAAFLISKYEVTQDQWTRSFGRNPSRQATPMRPGGVAITSRNPVERISWREASSAAGRWGLDLPTEAQWEYACRAGSTTTWSFGNDAEDVDEYANIADEGSKRFYPEGFPYEMGAHDGHGVHAPVGTFEPNAWGLHDMHGNVFEYCRATIYSYATTPGHEAVMDENNPVRGSRGGSFRFPAREARSAFRRWFSKDNNPDDTGLRPVATIER